MLFPGDWVEVLSAGEILSTLDEQHALEDLPFMPEMLPFCGRVFQVQIRADRTCVRALPPGETVPIRGLNDCVALTGLRCDGGSHGGCQLGCMFFWKERWLRKVEGPRQDQAAPLESRKADLRVSRGPDPSVFFCQGTELGKATRGGHSRWNPREYFRLLRAGTFTVPELVRMLHFAGSRRVEMMIRSRLPVRPTVKDQGAEVLGLQSGEWIEVRSMQEILATLDGLRCNKGLSFSNDMFAFCGNRLQVQTRIQTILSEETGRIRTVQNTVSLVGTNCRKYMGCARQMPLLWREVWLKRVSTSDS